MSECRCRALTLSLSQACFWAPKMRPILVTKTRPRSLQQTLKLQIWDPNSGTKKRSVAGHKLPLLGPRLARRDNLKFLRLTLPFVFSKLLACALSRTHGGVRDGEATDSAFSGPRNHGQYCCYAAPRVQMPPPNSTNKCPSKKVHKAQASKQQSCQRRF